MHNKQGDVTTFQAAIVAIVALVVFVVIPAIIEAI